MVRLWLTENSLKLFLVLCFLDTQSIEQNYHVNSQFTISGPFGDQSREHAIVGIARSKVNKSI